MDAELIVVAVAPVEESLNVGRRDLVLAYNGLKSVELGLAVVRPGMEDRVRCVMIR